MRPVCRILAAVSLAACGTKPAAAPASSAPPQGDPPSPTILQPPPMLAPPPPATVAPSELGYEGPPALPSPEARQANASGLPLHARGDYRGSRAAFEQALTAAPTFTVARFNLACALARLGDLRAARAEALRAAKEDPSDMLPRLHAAADLASLREDAGFEPTLERIQDALAAATREGLPVLLPPEEQVTWDCGCDGCVPCSYATIKVSVEQQRPARAGVLLKAARRFVPITATVAGATTGIIDRASGRVMLVAAHNAEIRESSLWASVDGVALFDPAQPFAPAMRLGDVGGDRLYGGSDASRHVAVGDFGRLELAGSPEGVFLRKVVSSTGYARDGWTLLARRGPDSTTTPTALEAPGATRWPTEELTLVVDEYHAYRRRGGADRPTVVLGDLVLPDGRRIRLPGGHRKSQLHDVVVDPSGNTALVASEHWAGMCTEVWAYTVDLVDLRTGAMTPVAAGSDARLGHHAVAIDVDADGWIVQLGHTLHTWQGEGPLRELVQGLTLEPRYFFASDSRCE